MPMHGHGFALMYLASVYGMETKESTREADQAEAVQKAVELTSPGPKPAPAAGPTFPAAGDEGSVTVTQVQAPARCAQRRLSACPAARSRKPCNTSSAAARRKGAFAIRWVPAAGRGWRFRPRPSPRSTTPANTTRRSPSAASNTSGKKFKRTTVGARGAATTTIRQLYASQGFLHGGRQILGRLFSRHRATSCSRSQDKGDGSWHGDGIGKAYGTAIALIILQFPYKYLPVFQR